MKTASLTAVVVLIIGILMANSVTAFEKGENRLLDSGFEVDTVDQLAQWVLEDGTCCDRGAEYYWEIDSSEAHTGSKCLKVIGAIASGTDWHAKVRHHNTSMELGRIFTIAFWAKVDANEAESREVSTSVQMQHEPWVHYRGNTIVLDSTDWKEYFDTFIASADVVEDMWVGLAIAQSAVDFWIDDFRFFEGEPGDEIDIVATVEIKLETLKLNSKGEFAAFVNLPEDYDEADIVVDTVECEGAVALKGTMADDDRLIVKFDRKDLGNVPTGDSVRLTVRGELTDGTVFGGSDSIRVIRPGKSAPAKQRRLSTVWGEMKSN